MKDINETHPSLIKNKMVTYSSEIKRHILAEDRWVSQDTGAICFLTFDMRDIQKYTIDKAVARKVFNEFMEHLKSHIGTGEIDDCEGKLRYLEIIYKEMGLNEK